MENFRMKTDNVTEPARPVIIYDGECNFCISGIRRIRDRDKTDQFLYTPKQTQDLHALYPQLLEIESNAGMRLIDHAGRVHCGADAVYQIYRRIGKFRYITWIYPVPVIKTLLKGIYLIISKNRSRLGRTKCESDRCPTE